MWPQDEAQRDLGQCFMFSKLLIETQISFGGYGKMAKHSDSEARLSGCKPWLRQFLSVSLDRFLQFSVNFVIISVRLN